MLKENLELVEVNYEDNKAVLVFLDAEEGSIHEVTFNKDKYDKDKEDFVADAEKAEKVEEWCQEHFNLPFDELEKAVGTAKDVYCYDKYNSLWEIKQIKKFDKSEVGSIYEVVIKNVYDNGSAVNFELEHNGELYGSKMQYSQYIESKDQWLVNPVKREKAYEDFKKKYGIPVDEMESLIGKTVMIEVKLAFKKHVYVDIKPLVKKK